MGKILIFKSIMSFTDILMRHINEKRKRREHAEKIMRLRCNRKIAIGNIAFCQRNKNASGHKLSDGLYIKIFLNVSIYFQNIITCTRTRPSPSIN